jgi:hypothetical protein
VTLTITEPQQTALLQHATNLLPLSLAFLLLPFAGRFRRNAGKLSRLCALFVFLLAGVCGSALLSGCGSRSGLTQSESVYPVTITATSGALSHSSIMTLVVESTHP